MPRRESATLKVLREIPDELKGTNVRLDRLESRVAAVESRIAALENRQTETEIRLATEIIAVARAVGDDHERRPAAFERRGA